MRNVMIGILVVGVLLSCMMQASGAQLKTIQAGTSTIAADASSTTASLTTVDMSKSFLVFGTSFDDSVGTPNCSQVSGQITNSTTLTVARAGSSGCPAITIEWYVAEFLSGVTVQRGSVANADIINIPITAVDMSKTVPMYTVRISGSNVNCDDFWRTRLSSSTNLELTANCVPGGVSGTLEWQVIEFTDSSVQTGEVSFLTTDTSKTANITSVDLDKSWLLVSMKTDTGDIANIGQKLVRGAITDATTLTFDRDSTGQALQVTYHVVEFSDGTTVQRGSSSFDSATVQNDVTISNVDPNWSLATAAGTGWRSGKTNYVTNDNMGVGSFTLDLTSPSNLRITRGATQSSTSDLGWFVVQFIGNVWEARELVAQADAGAFGVRLRWRTGYEPDTLGFRVFRESGGQRVQLTRGPIAGSALLARAGTNLKSGFSYAWIDPDGVPGDKYWLEVLDLGGENAWHGPWESRRSDLEDLASETFPRLAEIRTKSLSEIISEPRSEHYPINERVALPTTSRQHLENQWSIAGLPAIKLTVEREGWYRVSRHDLQQAGLDPAADARFLQLWADGREVPFLVESENSQRSWSALEFYGMGGDTPESKQRVYWLVEGDYPGSRIEPESRSSPRYVLGTWEDSVTLRSFAARTEQKPRSVYFGGLLNGKLENFFGGVVDRTGRLEQLVAQHVARTPGSDARVQIGLQGVTSGRHSVEVALNGFDIGLVEFSGQTLAAGCFTVPHELIVDGVNEITLTAEAGDTDISLLESVWIDYRRRFVAEEGQLLFESDANGSVRLESLPSRQLRVLDVSDPERVQTLSYSLVRLPFRAGGHQIELTVRRGQRILISTQEAMSPPSKIEWNQPSDWNRATGADLVIIAPGTYLDALQPLRSYRERQGYRVALVEAEDVYDEFGYGVRCTEAIRDFMRHAHSSWETAPSALLLVGDGTFDPRDYLGRSDFQFLPTPMVETRLLETSSDEWLVDFDGDFVGEIAVGRLPVRTLEEVQVLVEKILEYEERRGEKSSIVLVADQGDDFDYAGAIDELEATIEKPWGSEKIWSGVEGIPDARQQLFEAIESGVFLVNYLGHGSVEVWRGGLLDSSSARTLVNAPNYPLVLAMTCLNGFFQDLYTDSLGESLLLSRQGGAVAVWASSGLTPPQDQVELNREFYEALKYTGTLGEAILRAKNRVDSRDVRSTLILLGDPLLSLR